MSQQTPIAIIGQEERTLTSIREYLQTAEDMPSSIFTFLITAETTLESLLLEITTACPHGFLAIVDLVGNKPIIDKQELLTGLYEQNKQLSNEQPSIAINPYTNLYSYSENLYPPSLVTTLFPAIRRILGGNSNND